MAGITKMIFGDNSAEKAAEESKRAQAVANDRQLAELERQDKATTGSRAAPRGRRLFEDGPALASKVLG